MKRLLFQRITTFYTISSIYILSNPILPITKVTGMKDRFHQIVKNIPYQLTSYRSLLTTRTLTSENLDKFIVPNLIGTLDFAHEKQRFDNISSDVENIRQMINDLNDGKLDQQVTWVNALPF